MKLDPARSSVAIFTFAEGFLSAFAHDLELTAVDLRGDAEGDTCTIHIPIEAIRVAGITKGGVLHTETLSAGERASIEQQLRDDVMRGGLEIVARGTREGSRARIAITAPTGTAEVSTSIDLPMGGARARGAFDLSLRALGVAPVRGPMGAFRVADRVRITFDFAFVYS